jgi:hypothetical protein
MKNEFETREEIALNHPELVSVALKEENTV